MLVLSRKKDETIVIDGGTVVITIVGFVGDKVRVGVKAPRAISIHRGEIQKLVDDRKGKG